MPSGRSTSSLVGDQVESEPPKKVWKTMLSISWSAVVLMIRPGADTMCVPSM
jgi:hypothetical protein